MRTLGVGLIGAGRIGRLHAEHLIRHIPRARLLIAADVVLEAAQALDVPRAAVDYRAVLESRDVEAVLICSATDTHAGIIEDAAAAGKHVFCEKPIALTLEATDQALTAVERAGVKLQIGFNRRFDANYQRARQAIEQAEIGEPWLLHLISRDPAPPPPEYVRTSGGLFLDMTIHDFDMARFLIASEAREVYAVAGSRLEPPIGDVDTAITTLTFDDGTLATIDNSRQAVYGYDQRVEVLGSRGMLATDNIYPNAAHLGLATGMQRDVPLNFFMQRYRDSYRAEVTAFVDAVLDDTPPLVSGNDGRAALALGLAALRSFQERRPIRVGE